MNDKLTAKITPDMLSHLKAGGHKPNLTLLENAVERLCQAAMQKSAGQRKDDNPDNSVNWSSSEIDMCQYIILCEAVALVLSGELDKLKEAKQELMCRDCDYTDCVIQSGSLDSFDGCKRSRDEEGSA